MSDIVVRLQGDVATALKSGDKPKLLVLRMLLSAAKKVEIDSKQPLNEAGLFSIVEKLIKQRQESIAMYEKANRLEQAATEKAEIDYLQVYLPPKLDEAAIVQAIDNAIASTSAASIKDMGKVMGILKSELSGQADMSVVSKLLRDKLTAQ